MDPSRRRRDDSRDGYTFSYSPEADDQPYLALVRAVAWVKDTSALELQPLHYSTGIDELDGILVDSAPSGEREPGEQSLTFQYEGYRITVEPGEFQIVPE